MPFHAGKRKTRIRCPRQTDSDFSILVEEYTRKDGMTRDKGLKLELSGWGFVPSQGRIGQPPGQSAGTAQGPILSPDSTIDGERETLPG